MALRSLSTVALRRELQRREKGASKLQKKHSKLSQVLAKLESELADVGIVIVGGKRRGHPNVSKNKGPGRKPGRGGRRKTTARGARKLPKNKLGLADSIAAAVRAGSVVSPAEAMKRVKAAGYKSISKTLGIQVASTLSRDKRFKKKGRAQYERVAG